MRLSKLSILAALAFAAGCSSEAGTGTPSEPSSTSGQEPSSEMSGVVEAHPSGFEINQAPPMLGAHLARGEYSEGVLNKRDRHRGGSPDMTNHGGPIMTSAAVTAIFWGSSWGTSPGDKITGMDTWYQGFGGSGYAGTSDEYSSSNGTVSSTVTYAGHLVDTSAASGGGNTGAILAEVCKEIKSPVANGYYPVYTDIGRGNASYCAYHSNGTCGSVNVQFAFFWKLDGDPGCDPGSTVSGQSQGLQAIANVSGHELSEARTDPQGNAWFDGSGAENGDKCAWSWPAGAPTSVTFANGSTWKIQGEWSNAAYNASSGFANLSGQKGCIF